ncbi:MAG: hypothetical protein Q9170_003544 [Blastenia crenularia]
MFEEQITSGGDGGGDVVRRRGMSDESQAETRKESKMGTIMRPSINLLRQHFNPWEARTKYFALYSKLQHVKYNLDIMKKDNENIKKLFQEDENRTKISEADLEDTAKELQAARAQFRDTEMKFKNKEVQLLEKLQDDQKQVAAMRWHHAAKAGKYEEKLRGEDSWIYRIGTEILDIKAALCHMDLQTPQIKVQHGSLDAKIEPLDDPDDPDPKVTPKFGGVFKRLRMSKKSNR